MKNILIGLVAVTGILLVACSKDYNCECTVHQEANNDMYNIHTEYTEATHSTMTGKEDDVRAACKDSGFNISYKDSLETKHTITSTCLVK